MNITDYGRIAYEGYFGASDGKSLVSKEPLPPWEELPEDIRLAWTVAAAEVLLVRKHKEEQWS